MAEIPIITVDCELQGTEAIEAISKAFADLMAKKSFVLLPKGASLTTITVPDPPVATIPPSEVPVPAGTRKIDLDD